MKPKPRRPRNNLPLRRINIILLCVMALLLCNLTAGWIFIDENAGGNLAFGIQLATVVASGVLLAVLFVLNRRMLVEPIHNIAAWASRIRQGDFSARLSGGRSGLYALTDDINRLAEWLESLAELKNQELHERARIANELHDSLAQTIAGLRFQVRILDELLHQQEEGAVWQQLETVENMLEDANAELRGVIGYFRGAGAGKFVGESQPIKLAIKSLVARFRSEASIPLFFQDQWGEVEIAGERKMEIIRIIQEALANIRKHSRAKNARVLLRVDAGGKYSVLVEDDGVGISAGGESANKNKNGGDHIGLSVMAERARAIDADIQIESEPGEGARILLSFSIPPRKNLS